MIIMVRGNHGSGKSTVVRNVMQQMGLCTPLYGDLGPKAPEAYCCLRKITPKHVAGPPTFVLGPYQSNATCGFDYITKLGVKAATILLEKYRLKGNVLFESIMTSARILEPSIGRFIKANKEEIIIATLDTTFEECARSIEERKKTSVAGTKWNSTHLVAQQRMIERVTGQYTELGYRMEYVSRGMLVERVPPRRFWDG
jgi:hypothetical protein